MDELYIGLMSGTSADGIDAALVDFSDGAPRVVATHFQPYEPTLKEKILALYQPGANEIERMGEMDTLLGKAFAKAANTLLEKENVDAKHVKAIGSHGQTIRHLPDDPHHFTLQIGNPNIIAVETGIVTITDFRRKDLAHGGQGAPLAPAFHQYVLGRHNHDRAIVNIGGIANITLLTQNTNVTGYDTGPGNVLMDIWAQQHLNKPHDENGLWAAEGNVDQPLLNLMLSDPYFEIPAPKSTGREYFHANWLNDYLAQYSGTLAPADIQATLAELTALSILNEAHKHLESGEILICGGGARNDYLMQRLSDLAGRDFKVDSTAAHAIHPDWVEAIAFAWLAKQTLTKQPGNLPSVTGASCASVLGGVYAAD